MPHPDRLRGALLGSAIGDALGMPIEGLSHQNVRTYYRGIKGMQPDAKRGDLAAGQWTFRTQIALIIAADLVGSDRPSGHGDELRRLPDGVNPPAGAAPAVVAPLALASAVRGWSSEEVAERVREHVRRLWPAAESLAAACGHVHALCLALTARDALDAARFMEEVREATRSAEERFGASSRCSDRIEALIPRLRDFPLDLQEACAGTGFKPDEAWPFAVAMFARNPTLVEGSVLSAVNVGGDAPTIGACVAGLIGAFKGAAVLPAEWRSGVEEGAAIETLAGALSDAASPR